MDKGVIDQVKPQKNWLQENQENINYNIEEVLKIDFSTRTEDSPDSKIPILASDKDLLTQLLDSYFIVTGKDSI